MRDHACIRLSFNMMHRWRVVSGSLCHILVKALSEEEKADAIYLTARMFMQSC